MAEREPLPKQRQQLSDEAASFVRDKITSGIWRSGTRVKPEEVAAQLGISATPAREALQSLRSAGFLELMPRKGFTVARFTGSDIRDLFEVHSLLAGELTARAATNATEEEIAELNALQLELLAAWRRKDLKQLEEHNYAFHKYLYSLADSPKIEWALDIVYPYSTRGFYAEIEGWPEATASEHTAILEAMAARDPEAARIAMKEHIVHSGTLLAEYLENHVLEDRSLAGR